MVVVEVASNSVQSAIAAQKGGAVRVELCANLLEGGTTPSKSQIELARDNINIDLNVIIRPRGGDFFYDDLDFQSMLRDVEHCGESDCDGVVIGILDADGNVDMTRNAELITIARRYGMSVTFHRAFDRTNNLGKALEDIINLTCDRVLTSGGYMNAFDGRFVIRDLVKQADNRIIIMPGSGVNENNVFEIVKCTHAKEIHGTFQSLFDGKMNFHSSNFVEKSEYSYLLSDRKRVKNIVKNANL